MYTYRNQQSFFNVPTYHLICILVKHGRKSKLGVNMADSRCDRELEVRYAVVVWPTVLLDADGVTTDRILALIQDWD
jgi:hypothetical protein